MMFATVAIATAAVSAVHTTAAVSTAGGLLLGFPAASDGGLLVVLTRALGALWCAIAPDSHSSVQVHMLVLVLVAVAVIAVVRVPVPVCLLWWAQVGRILGRCGVPCL